MAFKVVQEGGGPLTWGQKGEEAVMPNDAMNGLLELHERVMHLARGYFDGRMTEGVVAVAKELHLLVNEAALVPVANCPSQRAPLGEGQVLMDERFRLHLLAAGEEVQGSRTDARLVGNVFYFRYPLAAIRLDNLGQFPVQQHFVVTALSGRRNFARREINASGELELSEYKFNAQ